MRKIIISGSEGLIGKELTKFFEKQDKVLKLDIQLGHDLTNEEFVKQWFKKNHAEYLINCFAINDHVTPKRKKNSLFDVSLKEFNDYLQVNLISLFSVCREFARNNKKGSIVNFSSTYGIVSPNPVLYDGAHKSIAYGVSKSGVINLTKYLAVHLAPDLRINCVVPGGIKLNQNTKFIQKYSKLTPMKRMMAKNELNGIMDYLCSERSSYTTGSTIVVDGGYTVW